MLASKLVGESGRVVAIEPSPTIFGVLASNLARNRAHNVRAVRVAASDSAGMLRLFQGPDSNLGRTTLLADEGFEFACMVKAAPLVAILRALLAVFRDSGFHAYTLENDYSPLSYLARYARKRPERLRVPIEGQADLVFSRQDSDVL